MVVLFKCKQDSKSLIYTIGNYNDLGLNKTTSFSIYNATTNYDPVVINFGYGYKAFIVLLYEITANYISDLILLIIDRSFSYCYKLANSSVSNSTTFKSLIDPYTHKDGLYIYQNVGPKILYTFYRLL